MVTSKSRSGRLMVWGALVVIGLSGCPPETEPFAYYYDYEFFEGRRTGLHLETYVIALVFDEDLPEAEQARIVEEHPILVGGSLYDPTGSYTAILIAPDTPEEDVLLTIDLLNLTPGVDWANPVVRRALPGGFFDNAMARAREPTAIGVKFVVFFSTETPEADITAVLEEYALTLLRVRPPSQ